MRPEPSEGERQNAAPTCAGGHVSVPPLRFQAGDRWSEMSRINLPTGQTIRVNTTSRFLTPDYMIEVQFRQSEGNTNDDGEPVTKCHELYLHSLVDERIESRSDVTVDVIQRAMDTWGEKYADKFDVEHIRNIEITEEEKIRERPFEDWRNDDVDGGDE